MPMCRLTVSWYSWVGSSVSWLPCKCSSLRFVSCPHSGATAVNWLPFMVSLSNEPAGILQMSPCALATKARHCTAEHVCACNNSRGCWLPDSNNKLHVIHQLEARRSLDSLHIAAHTTNTHRQSPRSFLLFAVLPNNPRLLRGTKAPATTPNGLVRFLSIA